MSDQQDGRVPGARPATVEDPMSADRRTLVVAAVAMVALVGVGVTSAALFTQSACEELVPEAVAASAAGADVGGVLRDSLADLAPEEAAGVAEDLAALGGPGGAVVGAADATGASMLVRLGGLPAAVGSTTTVLDPDGADAPRVEATAQLDDSATVVGDGDHAYALALVNELTGQVDAFAPLGPDLAEEHCTDTATVGVPLAFYLDAGDDQLLLFRVDEDGGGPELELRDADGQVWVEDLELGAGPPGALAERLHAALGDQLLVTARRTHADEQAPAVAAWDRADGRQRWTVAPEDLDGLAPAGSQALLPEVVAVTDEAVVVALGREQEDDATGATLLVGLDPDDGSLRWTSDLEADGAPEAGPADDGALLLAATQGQTQEATRLDLDDGTTSVLHATGGEQGHLSMIDDRLLLRADDTLDLLVPGEEARTLTTSVRVLDVLDDEGRAAVLVASDDHAAVVWLEL